MVGGLWATCLDRPLTEGEAVLPDYREQKKGLKAGSAYCACPGGSSAGSRSVHTGC